MKLNKFINLEFVGKSNEKMFFYEKTINISSIISYNYVYGEKYYNGQSLAITLSETNSTHTGHFETKRYFSTISKKSLDEALGVENLVPIKNDQKNKAS